MNPVSLCKVHGPDTSTGTEIENSMRVAADGCLVQLSSEQQRVDVVHHVHAVLLLVVVWLQPC